MRFISSPDALRNLVLPPGDRFRFELRAFSLRFTEAADKAMRPRYRIPDYGKMLEMGGYSRLPLGHWKSTIRDLPDVHFGMPTWSSTALEPSSCWADSR